jgi:hypothetical protein
MFSAPHYWPDRTIFKKWHGDWQKIAYFFGAPLLARDLILPRSGDTRSCLVHRQAKIDRLQRRVAADAEQRELGEAVRDERVHRGGRGERFANCWRDEDRKEERER